MGATKLPVLVHWPAPVGGEVLMRCLARWSLSPRYRAGSSSCARLLVRMPLRLGLKGINRKNSNLRGSPIRRVVKPLLTKSGPMAVLSRPTPMAIFIDAEAAKWPGL